MESLAEKIVQLNSVAGDFAETAINFRLKPEHLLPIARFTQRFGQVPKK
jgi:hypothetical protein